MATQRDLPIDGFKVLSPRISLLTHPEQSKHAGDPDLIVLCSWGWAKRKYISKYTNGYRQLYPSASILLVESEVADLVWRSYSEQQKRLAPAIDHMKSLNKLSNRKVLLVAMSDGGVNTAMNLGFALQKSKPPQSLPVQALVLDSAPMLSDIRRAYKGFATGLPGAFLPQMLGTVAILLLLSILKSMGNMGAFEVNRYALNAGLIIPKTCPRLYVFSKADELTDWRVVDQHAIEASAQGYSTKVEVFEKSAHCAHVLEDGKRYWASVDSLWKNIQ